MFFDLNLLAALKHNSSLGYTEKARCVSYEVMNSLAWLHFSGNQFGIKSFDMEMLCSGSRMWDLICERPFWFIQVYLQMNYCLLSNDIMI